MLELPQFNVHDPDHLEAAVKQLFVIGFHGHTLPAQIEAELNSGIGGVILFRRNVDHVDQVSELNASIHAAAGEIVPFVSLDQEGGRVTRLREPLTTVPTMRTIGDHRDLSLAADIAEVIATEVSALGFNLNYSPVVDVDTNPDNPVIGDRAFSRDPEWVTRMGGAFVAGHLAAGVVPCAKHFPGHGDTDTDSHKDLPTISHDRKRLDEVELYPFKKLVGIDVPMIMTAHVVTEALDDEHPATLSPAVLKTVLRDEYNYDGIVITDDLEMAAVDDRYEMDEMIDRGLAATVDIFLICHTFEKYQRAFDRVLQRATEEPDIREQVFRSANRIVKTKKSLLGSWPKPWSPMAGWQRVLGNADHMSTVARLDASFDGGDPTARG